MRTIDRYVIRQILWPTLLGLLVFTFILMIPVLLKIAEDLITKGVPTLVILQLMFTLLPSSLGLSVPMALLLGLLIGLGRLSSDREFVAMQACGISLMRLLRPVALLSSIAFATTLYILLVALPDANQAYREIAFRILVERAEGEVKPRVFFEQFPDLVLYVRDVPRTGGWNDVFMVDSRPGQPQSVYLAQRGRVSIDHQRRKVEMVLEHGSGHVADADGKYSVSTFNRQIISISPDRIFPTVGPSKGAREMSVAELRALIAGLEKRGESTQGYYVEIYKKVSIPFACLVLGLIGLALGATNRRDGRLASFVIGIVIIFTYYVLLESAANLAKGRLILPWLAVWLPNIVFGGLGLWLFVGRLRATDRPSRLLVWAARLRPFAPSLVARATARTNRFGTWRVPLMGLLDRYVMLMYVRVFALTIVALLGLFHLSTFIDLSDEVLRGDATWGALFAHLWYQTPQVVYYVLPMGVLLSALVTIGLLTRNSELVVMKACGISLYRASMPLVLFAGASTVAIVVLQERVLGPSNHEANRIRHVITGRAAQSFDILNRRWVAASNGDIYNYVNFNTLEQRLSGLSVYHFGAGMSLRGRTFVEHATYEGPGGAGGRTWRGEQGWTREFSDAAVAYRTFATDALALEPASYFSTELPEPDFMNYEELRGYISGLRDSGLDITPQRVALDRKVSFPFVTLIMTLIAIPFAVTTGTRGAMYGIGVGITLALTYWGAMSVFGALGAAGLMVPALAAWAPNLLFGAGAAYLVLTART